ncbi:hypothetical protein FOA52_014350 [Chlamydomonas sp. UWO 241]|nr:hypothetical protein FOA52_014350 [Chlamydomonas sp. UWO 241]
MIGTDRPIASSRGSSSSMERLLCVSFNQDGSCVALGTALGIRVYNRHSHSICYENLLGSVGIVEMLFCSSILAFVGAGEQPALTPRRMSVLNTSSQKTIQDIHFTSSVLAVFMNRQRLVVLLESKAFVYNVANLNLLRSMELPQGAGTRLPAAAALSACDAPNLLALPASTSSGMLRVYDLLFDGGNVLCEVPAHSAPLAALAWSHDAQLLASASTKGTVIRVHRMPQAARVFQLRRGTRPAQIHSLAFSPAGIEPPLLAACSSHGSVHVFRLSVDARGGGRGLSGGVGAAAAAASGLLSSFVKVNVADMVEPQRPIASIKLPRQPVAATCVLLLAAVDAAASRQQQQQQQQGGGQQAAPMGGNAPGGSSANASAAFASSSAAAGASSPSPHALPDAPPSSVMLAVATLDGLLYEYSSAATGASPPSPHALPDAPLSSVMLAVATLDGLLYEYRVTGLAVGVCAAALDGEWALLGSPSLG